MSEFINEVEKLLDMENQNTRSLWMGWDKGDCSKVGMVRILMLQAIEEEIAERGMFYDGCYDAIRTSLINDYRT